MEKNLEHLWDVNPFASWFRRKLVTFWLYHYGSLKKMYKENEAWVFPRVFGWYWGYTYGKWVGWFYVVVPEFIRIQSRLLPAKVWHKRCEWYILSPQGTQRWKMHDKSFFMVVAYRKEQCNILPWFPHIQIASFTKV